MRFLSYQLLGWFLVLLGLYIFYEVYPMLREDSRYFQSAPWVLVGIFVFRGGIQMLKVAVAARVCASANEQINDNRRAEIVATGKPASSGRTAPVGQT